MSDFAFPASDVRLPTNSGIRMQIGSDTVREVELATGWPVQGRTIRASADGRTVQFLLQYHSADPGKNAQWGVVVAAKGEPWRFFACSAPKRAVRSLRDEQLVMLAVFAAGLLPGSDYNRPPRYARKAATVREVFPKFEEDT